MNRFLIPNIIRFIILFAIQVILLNEVELHGFINPYIYPLFILLLPLETSRWASLFIAFGTGLTMDFFSNSMGLHAAACVFMAYARQVVLEFNRPRGGYEAGNRPTIKSLGFNWFFIYAAVLIFLHHLLFFSLEVFSFSQLIFTVTRIIVSTAFSMLLIVLYQYLANN